MERYKHTVNDLPADDAIGKLYVPGASTRVQFIPRARALGRHSYLIPDDTLN